MKNIREDKGLTYGIYSSIHTLINDNYLVIGADVNKENVDLTFTEIRKELQRLREEKIERDELQTARNHFIGSLQGEITTPFSHADKWKNIFLYNLGNDYYQRLINRLNTLDSSDLMKVAQKYYEENSFYEVAVG
jgi:predicted Zn-dependent peptidase